jgi:hypothetical protein
VRSGADEVKTKSLETIGNLAFARENKVTFLHTPELLSWLIRLAKGQVGGVLQKAVQIMATRALAILGGQPLTPASRHPFVLITCKWIPQRSFMWQTPLCEKRKK